MKRKTCTRALSLVLTALMLLSVIPLSASEAPPQPLIIDMSSQASAENTLKFSPSPESGLTGTNKDWGTNAGHYDFDVNESAFVIKKSAYKPATSYWRYLMQANAKAPNQIDSTQMYMVIVYKTDYNGETAVPINLNKFSKNAADQLMIEDDVRISKGNWVRTEAVNISNHPGETKNDLFYRLYTGNDFIMIAVPFPEDASGDLCLYIKEIAFFTSPEEANAYYLANLIKNPADITLTASVPESFLRL